MATRKQREHELAAQAVHAQGRRYLWLITGPAQRDSARLIDSHVHVWQRDPAFPFAQGRKPPEFDASAEMLLDLMAANGVARAVIVQLNHYRWDNS